MGCGGEQRVASHAGLARHEESTPSPLIKCEVSMSVCGEHAF